MELRSQPTPLAPDPSLTPPNDLFHDQILVSATNHGRTDGSTPHQLLLATAGPEFVPPGNKVKDHPDPTETVIASRYVNQDRGQWKAHLWDNGADEIYHLVDDCAVDHR